MPGLYFDTLIIDHTFCSMLSKLTEWTLQKLANFHDKYCVLEKTVKSQQKSNLWPLVPHSGASPLHHRVNWTYRLKPSFLNFLRVIGQSINKHS